MTALATRSGPRITAIEVLRAPEPDLGMSEAAIEAVSSWLYEPGTLAGRAVPVRLTVMVDFELH